MNCLCPKAEYGWCSQTDLASLHQGLLGLAAALVLVEPDSLCVLDDGLFTLIQRKHSPARNNVIFYYTLIIIIFYCYIYNVIVRRFDQLLIHNPKNYQISNQEANSDIIPKLISNYVKLSQQHFLHFNWMVPDWEYICKVKKSIVSPSSIYSTVLHT